MVDINRMFRSLILSDVLPVFAKRHPAAAATDSPRQCGRQRAVATQPKGLASVDTLSWEIYRQYRDGLSNASHQHTTPVDDAAWSNLPVSRFIQLEDRRRIRDHGLVLVKAAVAAAMADGRLTFKELQKAFGELNSTDLSNEEKALLSAEFQDPVSPGQLVKFVDDPALALKVYLVSRAGIVTSRQTGSNYLDCLAQALRVPIPLLALVESRLGAELAGAA